MSNIKKIMLVLFIILIGLQLVPFGIDDNNQKTSGDISQIVSVPKDVAVILKTSCYDCHSNYTQYPWYATIKPLRWLLNSHIKEGKNNLNFSEFSTYSNRKQQNKMRAIASTINDDSMPLSSYTFIHRNAILNYQNKVKLLNWVTKSIESISQTN